MYPTRLTKVYLYSVLAGLLSLASFRASAQCDGTRYLQPVFAQYDQTTVKYGENYTNVGALQALNMDIYQPRGDSAALRPVLIFAFGGSFTAGVRQSPDLIRICSDLAKRGYVCISIDYRIGVSDPKTKEKSIQAVVRGVQDMKAAVRFLKKSVVENGNPYRIDTAQIAVGGVSAGGFIGLHHVYMDDPQKFLALVDTTGFGPDLTSLEGNSGSPGYSSRAWGVINLCGALGDADWIDQGDQWVVSLHGTEDGTVPYGYDEITVLGDYDLYVDGSYTIDSTARAKGVSSALYTYQGLDHVPFINTDIAIIITQGLFNEPVMQATVNFIADNVYPHLDCARLSAADPTKHYTPIFNAYPNPATNGSLTVAQESEVLAPYNVQLIDITGKVVEQWQDLTDRYFGLDTRNYPNGIYFLNVMQGDKTGQRKVIINN